MSEPVFNSNLSEEEINSNFENVDVFTGIMSGLEEAQVYENNTEASEDSITSHHTL